MSYTVENDPWIDWDVITGPVDQYLYINLNPTLFLTPTEYDFRQAYKPLETTYNGEVQTRDIVDSVFIITQIGTNEIDKLPFNDEINNPYNYGTSGPSCLDRKPWRIEMIPLNDPGLTLDIKYDSRLGQISSVPKNVGRYDITINATYVRNRPVVPLPWRSITNPTAPYPTHKHNGTYRGFWSSYEAKPSTGPNAVPNQNSDFFAGITSSIYNLEFETDLNNIDIYKRPYKGYTNEWKYLVIHPCPITIEFVGDEFAYTGNVLSPTYITNPQLLDSTHPNAPGNVQVRLTYAGDKVISELAPPIEIGAYTITATSTDFNYIGSATAPFTIRNLTNIEATENAILYQEKAELFENVTSGLNGSGNVSNFEGNNVYTSTSGISSGSSLINSNYASSSNRMTKEEFIQTGVLTILDKADIEGLGTIRTLAECAQSLPQRLMMVAAAKIAGFILSYIPGTGIIQLLTSVMDIIKKVQEILALIEFVKENPWAALNMVLETSGAYDALGNLANEQIAAIQASFPGMTGDVGQFVKDVANGLVDICNMDMTLIKADNTKVPEAVVGFIPPTSRQPIEEKARYDLFQLRLRDALYKDSEKMDAMNAAGNITGVQEYVSMLTAVHELAYNYHDRIASTGYGTGLIDSDGPDSPIGFGGKLNSAYAILGDATSILSSVYPQNATETPATVTSASGGKKKTAFSIDSLNSGLGAVANTISGVTAGLNSVTSFMSGETGFSLKAFKNEFNYAAKETLRKNPFWSKETISEYNKRVNRIKFEMETNAEAIRNNPANASAASAGQGLSNGASTGGIFKGSPLAGSLSSWTGGKWMS